MPGRRSPAARSRRLRMAVVAGALPLLVACAPGSAAPASPGPPDTPEVTVVQMNLCDSGIAGCYTGRAVEAAADLVRTEMPDAVTLNEVCRAGVERIERALAGAAPGSSTSSSFQPARERDTGAPYRCANGDEYGIGVVSRAPSSVASAGIHPAQDPRDPEERAWLCLDTTTAGGPLGVCTSHLAYTDRAVTRAQCGYLFDTVVAGLRSRADAGPVVVGADLNLGAADDPDLRSCLPPGSAPAADDGVQHVVVIPAAAAARTRVIDLGGTTDHPALLVTVRPEAGSA
ncbi:endonuclease/exonuclease/phosphatase family protein [Pseudonocardia sp. McavD-2-B]|nr:endonuclease/exonuclease/phosphatase family protein [Pseudonocardia sp. McavD-2-B]MCO7192209.1 endonuclease/exonuclease/phosphatase family protein [Pseudonocardia sp. McavD-2-B]